MPEFEGVPEWPEQKLSSGRDARLDNEPPLEERILLQFQEDLDVAEEGQKLSISERIAELMASCARVPAIDNDKIAGSVGDLIQMASNVSKRIDIAREKHNRPLLNAQRALKGKADGVFADLATEIERVRGKLNAYMQDKRRKEDEERRAAEEAARKAAEAARAATPADEPAPIVDIAPAPVEKAIARGSLGAKVSTQKKWHHEILSVRQLPDRILKHPKVVEAMSSVINAEIRSGTREIKGTRIWDTDEAVVR